MVSRWVQSDGGFRGPVHMVDYVERDLRGSLDTAEAGIPIEESPNNVVAVLLLIELARSLFGQLNVWWIALPQYHAHPRADRSPFSPD
jgi:hypothetical protein